MCDQQIFSNFYWLTLAVFVAENQSLLVVPVGAFDYKACLHRLSLAYETADRDIITRECQSLPSPDLILYSSASLTDYAQDFHSTSILVESFPETAAHRTAVRTSGDGNCLFNAASLYLAG